MSPPNMVSTAIVPGATAAITPPERVDEGVVAAAGLEIDEGEAGEEVLIEEEVLAAKS